MKNIIVFCGSRDGYNDTYRESAYNVGSYLAAKGIHTIYGGAKVGLMGALADGVLDKGGKITGVIPEFLKKKELIHEGLANLIIVNSMHERKMVMYNSGDGIITLPGGWGTMDELFETLTWGQLGLHAKPVGLLNVNGYYDALKVFCDNMVQEGFLEEKFLQKLFVSESVEELFGFLNFAHREEMEQRTANR